MDNAILKKRLSTFKTEKGTITGANNELLVDLLRAWELWSGTSKEFHMSLGLSKSQLGGLMGKAKRLIKSGAVVESEFKEITSESGTGFMGLAPCQGIELSWSEGRVIRFPSVEPLLEFLKRAA
jgi:transposase